MGVAQMFVNISVTLTCLINVEDGINEEGRQIFLNTYNMRGGRRVIFYMKGGKKSGKTISDTPRLLDE